MIPSLIAALCLALLAAAAHAPGLVLLAVLGLGTAAASGLWSRHGLHAVTYERTLTSDRAVWGDSVEMVVSVANMKLLPLAWLQAEDFASEDLTVRERPLSASDRPGLGVLRQVWTLAPYQRVRRRVHLDATQRGRYRFESVRLTVADVFGHGAAAREEPQVATLLIRPRTVIVRAGPSGVAPLGMRAARYGLAEDPAMFAGVRPFQPGDPRRRVHERASARMRKPVSKRFEPSTAREVIVAVDIRTHDGPPWLLAYDENLVESLVVAAGSLARHLLAQGAACGIAVNGWSYSRSRWGFVPPSAAPNQLARILDLLARTSSTPSLPADRMLLELPARTPPSALVVTLSCRDPRQSARALRGLRASGFELRHVALGPAAGQHRSTARRLGIAAVEGRLSPDWRTCHALDLAS